jgi:hypothetical protein
MAGSMPGRGHKALKRETVEDMDELEQIAYWQSRTASERLVEAWRLTCQKYGIDPNERMDRECLEVRRLAWPDVDDNVS